MENTGGDSVQDVFYAAEVEGMPRVGPSLETGYDIVAGG